MNKDKAASVWVERLAQGDGQGCPCCEPTASTELMLILLAVVICTLSYLFGRPDEKEGRQA